MFENNIEKEIGLTKFDKFLQKNGVVKQAIDMFGASSTIELPKNGEITIRG